MATITLKASFQNATRRFPIPQNVSFSALQALLIQRFSCDIPFVITYQDSDNDIITISSDDELTELITTAEQANLPVRIHMFTHQEVDAGATAPRSLLPSQPNVLHVPHIEELLGGLSELLSAVKHNINTPRTTPPITASRGFERPTPMHHAHGGEQTPRARRGLLSGLRPYMSAFPSGRGALKKNLGSVSPSVKTQFKHLVRYVRKSDDRANIVSAIKEAFPVLRGWISDELDDVGLPEPDKVDNLIEAVESVLMPKAGEEPTKKITTFMRLALADQVVVNMLRKVREMGPMPWEDGFVPMLRNRPRGFDVHQRVSCKGCDMKPIVGMRYMSTNKEGFNLCATCHGNDQIAKDGLEFKECKFAWEDKFDNLKVPPAPLKPKDRGPKVKFLHKVLTDLGYMNEGMYNNRPGFYTNSTRASVQQFQMEKGLGSTCEFGIYDEPTATRLADEVGKHDENMHADDAAGADQN